MKIKLERLKSKAGEMWAEQRWDRLVRIIGDGWYWKKNRAGYTDDGLQTGVYTLSDALNASSHCGPEKHIVYDFLPQWQGETTQQIMTNDLKRCGNTTTKLCFPLMKPLET